MIDFHSHFFSYPFFEALAGQSPLAGTVEEKLSRVAERTGLELPDRDLSVHLARWQEQLDRHGVDHLVTFASLPDEAPAVAEAAAMASGRITPFALVNPNAEDASKKVRMLLSDKGFRGVLLFPAMHHFRVGGDAAAAVLEVVEEMGGFCVVHCGMLQVKLRDLLELPRPYDLSYANPLDIVPAANRYPNVRFVIPHFGAGFLRETLMVGSQCENVYVDTSSSNSWVATQEVELTLTQVFKRAIDVFGAERILFGTDSSTFPGGWRVDRYEEQRDALVAAGADESELGLVFDGNARRLLGLAG